MVSAPRFPTLPRPRTAHALHLQGRKREGWPKPSAKGYQCPKHLPQPQKCNHLWADPQQQQRKRLAQVKEDVSIIADKEPEIQIRK